MKKMLFLLSAAALLAGCGTSTTNTNVVNANNTTNVTNISVTQPCGDSICDEAEQGDSKLCPQDCSTTTSTNTTTIEQTGPLASDLVFIPDAGVRMSNASNAGVKFTDATTMELLYENQRAAPGASRQVIASATADSDWLDFTVTNPAADGDNFRALKLPDGTCRAYGFNNTKGLTNGETGMTSRSSTDCITFTPDPGTRYTLQSADNGTLGVYDFFNDTKGGVVMLYLGDLYGLNNARRAYSTDNGWTFTFTNDNVLGDADLGGGSNSYVDEKTIRLADGRIRLIAMQRGSIHSFISKDDGITFTKEAGIRLQASDFTELGLTSFNDPQIIALPDGRYRIYVTGYTSDKTALPVLASSTTAL